MPSWPAVIVGAAVLGAVIGAAQPDDDSVPPDAAPATAAQEQAAASPDSSPSPVPAPSSERAGPADPPGSSRQAARWPSGVASTLPGQTDPPRIALTFDDGPDPRWTPRVLDVLARHDVTATFCLVGEQVAGREQILERIHREGHVLCNHSTTHDYGLAAGDPEQVTGEIDMATRLVAQAVPQAEVTAFRAPAGRFAPGVVDEARDLGLDSWGWSVDSLDWNTDNSDRIVTTVLDGIAPGAVVLLHDGGGDRSATVAALAEIIPVLASVGYEFVGLPDLP